MFVCTFLRFGHLRILMNENIYKLSPFTNTDKGNNELALNGIMSPTHGERDILIFVRILLALALELTLALVSALV